MNAGMTRPLVMPSSVPPTSTAVIDGSSPIAIQRNAQLASTPMVPVTMNGRCPKRLAARLLNTADTPDVRATGDVASPARAMSQPHWFTVCCTNAQLTA
jgi:hypothetical protein